MQESITKALLFVIALSTSIIAVELIPQHKVNKAKLLCAEFNTAKYSDYGHTSWSENGYKILELIDWDDTKNILVGYEANLSKIKYFCESL